MRDPLYFPFFYSLTKSSLSLGCQIPVEFDYTLKGKPGSNIKLEFALKTASEEVLQVVSQEVRVAGVLVDMDSSSDQSNVSQDRLSNLSSAPPRQSVDEVEEQVREKQASKGFFSWLKG